MTNVSRLKELRLTRGMTQKDLAAVLGLQTYSVQRLEYGTARPSLEMLVAIADFFDVSLDYLVGRSDEMKRR